MLKKLGVIGGMGSEATSYYFGQLIAHTKAYKDQDYIDTIILNHASLPDRTESILNDDTDELYQELLNDAKALERLGVDNIAIPCNTAHFFYDSIAKEISIPVIHMVRETISYVLTQDKNVKKIGVLATNGTINSRVYHNECERLDIELITPSEARQADIMSLIYDDIKSGNTGDYKKFKYAYEDLMKENCDVVILACTELSVFKKSNINYENCIDAMDILVKESIVQSGASYQKQ